MVDFISMDIQKLNDEADDKMMKDYTSEETAVVKDPFSDLNGQRKSLHENVATRVVTANDKDVDANSFNPVLSNPTF